MLSKRLNQEPKKHRTAKRVRFKISAILLYIIEIDESQNMGNAIQMNVRIDPYLKEEGDRVFAKHGLSPSQAVRALYSSVTGAKKQCDEVLKAIAGSESTSNDEGKRAKIEGVRAMQDKIRKMHSDLGITHEDGTFSEVSDRELLEEALIEKYV